MYILKRKKNWGCEETGHTYNLKVDNTISKTKKKAESNLVGYENFIKLCLCSNPSLIFPNFWHMLWINGYLTAPMWYGHKYYPTKS